MFKYIGKFINTTIKLLITASLICICIAVYAGYIEPNMLKTAEVEISSPVSLSSDLQTYTSDSISDTSVKIVLFGDTHLGFNYDITQLHKVIDKINAQNPDIIVFSGDLIDNLNTYSENTAAVSSALSELYAPGGKYAVHGNHDYELSGNDPYAQIMTDGGFKVLVNETLYLPDYNMNIFGITDCLIGKPDISMLSAAGPDTFNLVICHEPDIFDQLSDRNVSLMLSGHTHGGQVNIPIFTERFLPALGTKYVSGIFTAVRNNGDFTDGTASSNSRLNTLYVTKGIGTTKLPLRFMAKPEIAAITLR